MDGERRVPASTSNIYFGLPPCQSEHSRTAAMTDRGSTSSTALHFQHRRHAGLKLHVDRHHAVAGVRPPLGQRTDRKRRQDHFTSLASPRTSASISSHFGLPTDDP
jgi:hypothetical protein